LGNNWPKRDEENLSIYKPGARRTVEISKAGGNFSGLRPNSETKEFSGTGGGTYTAQGWESIAEDDQTFSHEDDSRVVRVN